MSTAAPAITAFDPDAFMAQRATTPAAPAPAFDPDAFMQSRQATAQPGGQITGVSAPQGDTVKVAGTDFQRPPEDAGYKVDKWLESAKNDLNNGTDATGIGRLYKSMGGHGLNVGTSAQDFLPKIQQFASVLLGGPGTAETVGPPLTDELAKLPPSAKLAKAGQLFNEVSTKVGEDTVQVTDRLKDAMDAIKENIGGTKPPVLNQLMDRMVANGPGDSILPLTYNEARSAYHNLSDLTATDRMSMNKNMSRLLGEFKGALGEAISKTAESGGKLDQYRQAMSTFAHGKAQQEKLEIFVDWAKKLGIGGAITVTGGGLSAAGWDLYQKWFGGK